MPRSESEHPREAETAPAVDEWSYLAFCPNCGSKLQNIKCKARCGRCGFFQDCGDTIV